MTRRLIDLPEMIVRDVAGLRGQSGNMLRVSPEELDRIVSSRLAEVAPCPGGGYTAQPKDEDATVENCLRAGVCGCDLGAALAPAPTGKPTP